jgi:hypothetical protein
VTEADIDEMKSQLRVALGTLENVRRFMLTSGEGHNSKLKVYDDVITTIDYLKGCNV